MSKNEEGKRERLDTDLHSTATGTTTVALFAPPSLTSATTSSVSPKTAALQALRTRQTAKRALLKSPMMLKRDLIRDAPGRCLRRALARRASGLAAAGVCQQQLRGGAPARARAPHQVCLCLCLCLCLHVCARARVCVCVNSNSVVVHPLVHVRPITRVLPPRIRGNCAHAHTHTRTA